MQIKDAHKDRRGLVVLIATCFLLQVMISPNVGMGNGRFNFLMVFAGVYALLYGGRGAVGAGFVAGLLFDLLSTGPVGLMALLLCIFSYVLGLEERNRFSDGFVACLSAYGTGSLAVTLTYHVAMLLVGESASVLDLIMLRVLPTYALSFVAFLPFAWVQVRNAGSRTLGQGSHASAPKAKQYDVRNL